ncbi:hypothetical protein DENIT_110279 [Pseudomonas veronii]|nr:hypothetical protein DENIT_110279 [Pseudomonas veronii]
MTMFRASTRDSSDTLPPRGLSVPNAQKIADNLVLEPLHRLTIPQLSLCLFKRIPDNRAPVIAGALPVRFF